MPGFNMKEINRKPLEHQRIWFCYLKVVVRLKVNLGVMGSQISGVFIGLYCCHCCWWCCSCRTHRFKMFLSSQLISLDMNCSCHVGITSNHCPPSLSAVFIIMEMLHILYTLTFTAFVWQSSNLLLAACIFKNSISSILFRE